MIHNALEGRPNVANIAPPTRSPRLLVFPLDLDEVAPVIRIASMLGIEVIGASSAMSEPGRNAVRHFVQLPFVTDAAFDEALRKTVRKYEITDIFSSHHGVWQHLDALVKTSPDFGSLSLCHPDPFISTWQAFSPHEKWAAVAQNDPTVEWIDSSIIRPALTGSTYAALHRQFLNTPGQSDEAKLLALCSIARLLPEGDLLEVGCLYGRSSLALGFLANRHRIGNLICVDPWSTAKVTDQGTQAVLLNTERTKVDFDQVFTIFLSTVAMLENVGYIRNTSAAAHEVYESALMVGHLDSAGLGRIALSSQLSLVHIDGNHRYDHVRQDVDLWSSHLVSRGWLLLDDYVWAFGDGPKRVGDELLSSPLYDLAFVCGDTLFLRRA